jgi:hypothetical protein
MGCKGKCVHYKAKSLGRYVHRQKRCQVCDIYLRWEGFYCPCCGHYLRARARDVKYESG